MVTLFGLFEYVGRPLNLRNAAQTFQCLINKVTHGLDFVLACLDDVLVTGSATDGHQQHLRLLFDRLQYSVSSLIQQSKFTAYLTLTFLDTVFVSQRTQLGETKEAAI